MRESRSSGESVFSGKAKRRFKRYCTYQVCPSTHVYTLSNISSGSSFPSFSKKEWAKEKYTSLLILSKNNFGVD
jgi:hypothetical protein